MCNPLRPLHVGKYFPPFHGGMETFLADLTCAQLARGDVPQVLAHAAGRGGSDIWKCPDAGKQLSVSLATTYGRLLYAPVSPAFPALMRQILRSTSPQLLHLHLPNPSAFWALTLPEARHIPWVVHWHADAVNSRVNRKIRLAYPVYRRFEQRLLARANAVVVTSPPYLTTSPALAPWHSKCRVIPLGVDPERLATAGAARAPAWPAIGLKILAVGRLSYYKGFEHLLHAVALHPGLQLILVGNGELRNSLEQQRRQLGITSRVRLAGSLDDATLAALMKDCDCLCLPSIDRSEAFGMVLLEAMKAAKAVVVSDVPGSGMGWVVQHKVTGLKVPPADAAALGTALLQLAEHPELCRKMGTQGRMRFVRLFQISAVAERISELYREVLA